MERVPSASRLNRGPIVELSGLLLSHPPTPLAEVIFRAAIARPDGADRSVAGRPHDAGGSAGDSRRRRRCFGFARRSGRDRRAHQGSGRARGAHPGQRHLERHGCGPGDDSDGDDDGRGRVHLLAGGRGVRSLRPRSCEHLPEFVGRQHGRVVAVAVAVGDRQPVLLALHRVPAVPGRVVAAALHACPRPHPAPLSPALRAGRCGRRPSAVPAIIPLWTELRLPPWSLRGRIHLPLPGGPVARRVLRAGRPLL
eukprot:scaffold12630_cov118-Isochrysis_galbana.AAC.8